MFNQPQSLPVRADMPDSSAFVQGVPYSVPFVPQIQVRPQQQQMLPLITGYTMHELQSNAQKNPQRCFLFNSMSVNRWQNQQFAELVKSVGDYAEFLASTGQVQGAEAAIQRAANQMCTIMVAVYVSQYPALQQGMNQQQWGDMQQAQQLYNQIGAAIRQFQSQSQGFGNTQMGGMPQSGQWQTVHATGGGHQWNGGPQAAPSNLGVGPQVSNWNHGMQSPAFQAPTDNSRQFRSSLRSTPVVPQDDNLDSVSFGPTGVDIREVAPAANFSAGNIMEQKPNVVDQPAFGADGSEVRLAASSGWNRTFAPQAAYAAAFNPRTHVLKHIRHADGHVTELIEEKLANMKYDDHELNPIFRLKSREQALASGARIDPTWDILPHMQAAPAKPLEIEGEEPGLKELDAPIFLTEEIQAHSLEEAGLKARLTLLGRDIKLADSAPFEYYVERTIPMFTSGGSLIGVFNGLHGKKQIVELAVVMEDLAQSGMCTEAWHAVNDRLTETLNEFLEYNTGLTGWKIENFTSDAKELFVLLEQKYGEGLVNTLNARTGTLVEAAISCLRGDRLSHYVESLTEDIEIAGDGEGNPCEGLIVFSEKISVTHVPWLGSQIDVAMKAKAGAVMETYLPELYRAIKAIMRRVKDREELGSQAFRYVYIVTADNVKIRIHEGFMGKDFYLISVE